MILPLPRNELTCSMQCRTTRLLCQVFKLQAFVSKSCKRHGCIQQRYCSGCSVRRNAVNIQMLSEYLQRQLFRSESSTEPCSQTLSSVQRHLSEHDLWSRTSPALPDVELDLPPLVGANIDEHFRELATRQAEPYTKLAGYIASSALPRRPRKWAMRNGWTKYDAVSKTTCSVDFPDDDGLVFDVEVLMTEGGQFPTLAVAASSTAWYSWCSERLLKDHFKLKQQKPTTSDLIPLETALNKTKPADGWRKRLVIGHNVGFDRSFVKEQYYIKGPQTRFLDTMSFHICVSGQTSFQRALYIAKRKKTHPKEVREMEDKQWIRGPPNFDWAKESTLNNLSDVYQLHCKGQPLEKESRDVFVKGTMADVRNDFQNLMNYCASDVKATHSVFRKLWPAFLERLPHPVTIAGMLEMGSTYLPVDTRWDRYISQSEDTHDELQHESQLSLMRLADDACGLKHADRYKDDVWLWDLDWSTRDNKFTGLKIKNQTKRKSESKPVDSEAEMKDRGKGVAEGPEDRIKRLIEITQAMPKRQPHMPGYPKWYSELCPSLRELQTEGAVAGPSLISTMRRVTPKLLRLTWDGFPLHYHDTHGWGYLVPGRHVPQVGTEEGNEEEKPDTDVFPLKFLCDVCKPILGKHLESSQPQLDTLDKLYEKMETVTDENEKAKYWQAILGNEKKLKAKNSQHTDEPFFHKGIGPCDDVELPGCWFFKLPHKDGPHNRVGNPLAKDFLSKIEDGVLQSEGGLKAERVLRLRTMCSYWKNNRLRICSQMVVPLRKAELPSLVTRHEAYSEDAMYGAILPRVVAAGTVTRRAVEATWMTASNAYSDRVGSELKSMVHSPPGYHIVGADVDSQELWIASILGDAQFAGIHGCTALSWMTLQGSKAEGTDLHSKTAALVGTTREQAKVFNYARIYGAGKLFAQRILMQFNHRLTKDEAKHKADAMYVATKGRRTKLSLSDKNTADEMDEQNEKQAVSRWIGGSESEMFNRLESIATGADPRTPVLGCRISKALEPRNVNSDFMTSRINWVVQSSAVDYLHLTLVSMRALLDEFHIDARFAISIHDEVRYLVASGDRYRAALALQISNLLTRAMFAYSLGLNDLPQSVAFFSKVDIDTCLRKEVTMDCVTPSNPRGLHKGYNIPPGEALDIYEILKKTNKSLLAPEQPKAEPQRIEQSCVQ